MEADLRVSFKVGMLGLNMDCGGMTPDMSAHSKSSRCLRVSFAFFAVFARLLYFVKSAQTCHMKRVQT